MVRVLFSCLTAFVFLVCISCKSNRTNESLQNLFESGVELAVIQDELLEEASGLAASVNNPDLLWTHNDSGDKPRIFLIDKTGTVKATVWLDSAKNRDWEDMAIGPGPEEGKTYLYIGEIGDNESEYNYKYIYRIEEPVIDVTKTKDTTIQKVDAIKFQYPDGLRDAESLMIDPLTKDLFVISKRELKANVYRLPYPYSINKLNTVERVITEIDFDLTSHVDTIRKNNETLIKGYHPKFYYQIAAADISPDGNEVLVKSYSTVYYWRRQKNESIASLLQRPPMQLPYDPEPQGEAICFDNKGKGYYTINEKMKKMEQKLVFYKRK